MVSYNHAWTIDMLSLNMTGEQTQCHNEQCYYAGKSIQNTTSVITPFFTYRIRSNYRTVYLSSFRPCHAKRCLRVYADSEGPAYRIIWYGKQRPWWYFMHMQDDLNLRILCMFDGPFSHDAVFFFFFFFFFFFLLKKKKNNSSKISTYKGKIK